MMRPHMFENYSIKRLAKKLLQHDGDFIFIGGSPIILGLSMLQIAPERNFQFVSFSGKWMNNYNNRMQNQYYDRLRYPRQDMRQSYLSYLNNHHGISIQTIASGANPTNILDFCSSGGGLISFVDLIVADSRTAAQAKTTASRFNLLQIIDARSKKAKTEQSIWTCGSLGRLEIPTFCHSLRHSIWRKHMLGSSRNYEDDAPRLTAPYLQTDWHSPPQPARPSNIAAFRRAAQGIEPARLKAAFGLQLP